MLAAENGAIRGVADCNRLFAFRCLVGVLSMMRRWNVDAVQIVTWAAVICMAGAGAWMFFALRPVSPWYRLIGMYVPAVAGGVAISLSLCEYYAIESLHHKMMAAFGSGLVCMPVSGAFLRIAESEAFNWMKQRIAQVFGFKSSDEADPPQGGNPDA